MYSSHLLVQFTGMLSKSRGQILRMAATMHLLFHWSNSVSNEALKAAQSFVKLCTQHAAFLAGRGNIDDEIHSISDKG